MLILAYFNTKYVITTDMIFNRDPFVGHTINTVFIFRQMDKANFAVRVPTSLVLCSALIAYKQGGIFVVLCSLRHNASYHAFICFLQITSERVLRTCFSPDSYGTVGNLHDLVAIPR